MDDRGWKHTRSFDFRVGESDVERLTARITELEADLAALRNAARWVPVGERLPKKLGNVEIWRKRALAAEADLTALRERMRWVPVSERLPPMGQEVDLWDGFGRLPDYHRDGDADLWEWFNVHGEPIGDVPGAGDPTHWRPMPAPPVVSKTERSEDA